MSLRIESSVVPWLIVAVAPALALAAGGCGDEFESCESRRACPAGKGGSAGSGGEAGSVDSPLGGGGNAGTGGGGSGTGGESRGGASGTSGDGGVSGVGGGQGGNGGGSASGGSAGRIDAGGEGGQVDAGAGGEAGDTMITPDPCESITCEHGTCANVHGEGTCECEPGFTGTRCELPTFEWINFLPGHDTGTPYMMSEDGTVLARSCRSDDCVATYTWFRWTHEAGASALSGSESVEIYGTNRDASVLVGQFSTPSRAFRWTDASGFVSLGVLPGDDASSFSSASDVSSDGSVVVGYSDQSPFRWTLGTGMVKLGTPTGAPSDSIAYPRVVSSDGSIIAGNLRHLSTSNLVRWTETGEAEWIEPARHAEVTGMSADGEVIVGNADFAGVREAYRWTRAGGIVSLGRPAPCDRGTYAWGMSGDGRVIAISCLSLDQSYLWDVDNGFRRLEHVLESIGADISEAGPMTVRGLSFDAGTMMGMASGSPRPWIARLPPVRE